MACKWAAAVTNVWQFYLARFLLGVAEGGACLSCQQHLKRTHRKVGPCKKSVYMQDMHAHFTVLHEALQYIGCCLHALLKLCRTGTFPGTFYHASLFFSTGELTLGYSAVTSATAISQVVSDHLLFLYVCSCRHMPRPAVGCAKSGF